MPSDCPSIETLAAYLEQSLTPGEREEIEHHLVSCGICRETLRDALLNEVSPPGKDAE